VIGKDGFWEIIETYGLLIRPAEVALYLTAVAVMGWLVLTSGRAQAWVTKLHLATAFAWSGAARQSEQTEGRSTRFPAADPCER